MNHRLLTPDEVAERWSVPRAHVYRLAREGRIPAVDFAAQRVHVRRSYAQYSRRVKAPKSGRVRSVPLVPELIGPLDGLSRPSEVAARFAATRVSAFNPRGPRAGWGVPVACSRRANRRTSSTRCGRSRLYARVARETVSTLI